MGLVNIGPLYAGDTHTAEFTCEEPDGSAVDLTGCTIRWGYALRATPNTPVATHTTDTIIRVIDATDGILAVFLSTAGIPAGNYVHELEVNKPTGETYTYARGLMTILQPLYPSTYPA